MARVSNRPADAAGSKQHVQHLAAGCLMDHNPNMCCSEAEELDEQKHEHAAARAGSCVAPRRQEQASDADAEQAAGASHDVFCRKGIKIRLCALRTSASSTDCSLRVWLGPSSGCGLSSTFLVAFLAALQAILALRHSTLPADLQRIDTHPHEDSDPCAASQNNAAAAACRARSDTTMPSQQQAQKTSH